MGSVHRARDEATGAAVALKVLRGAAAAGDEERRFAREAATLAELDHPGIVRYVAHGGAAEGDAYLAMEWIEGETLSARLARGPLSVDDTLALGFRMATALGAAHARGVVHRDLKPGNVMLPDGGLGETKLVDFGLAAFSQAGRTTLSGALLGTPAYMAPERARGERALDPRVDVFALGAILHECLTGKPAFEGAHVMAVLARIVFDEVPRLRDLGCAVPPPLDALIAAMLAKDPRARPADGGAVAAALAVLAALAGEPPRSGPLSRSPSSRGITRAERRVASILLGRGPDGAARRARPDETLHSAGEPAPRDLPPVVGARG